jgi:3',5'-cyclic AMP phosphodiesterase CpdA
MPIHLPPISRRQFVRGTLAAGAGLLLSQRLPAQEPPADPNCFALLADTHVCGLRDQGAGGVKPVMQFEQAARGILGLAARPAGAIIAGDCAFIEGLASDYGRLAQLLRPLRQAGVPIHLVPGNHDHRERLLAAFSDVKSPTTVKLHVFSKYDLSVLETPHANWFLLDSLDRCPDVPGLLGEAQLAWLAYSLDARPDKPALVLAHHYPDRHNRPPRGLIDTEAFFKIIAPRKQVKTYFFGHKHEWHLDQESGVHLVNLPTTAWLFDQTQPQGRNYGPTARRSCCTHSIRGIRSTARRSI